jgi:hypothetical protein
MLPFEVLIYTIDGMLVLNAYQHPVRREVGKHARPERAARYVARAEKSSRERHSRWVEVVESKQGHSHGLRGNVPCFVLVRQEAAANKQSDADQATQAGFLLSLT